MAVSGKDAGSLEATELRREEETCDGRFGTAASPARIIATAGGNDRAHAPNYGRQLSGNALASVIAAAGCPGAFRYSLTLPVAVSATRIT